MNTPNYRKITVLRELVSVVQSKTSWEADVRDRVICRLIQSQLTTVPDVALDKDLPLSERLRPYMSDEFDVQYGMALARRYGFSWRSGIRQYDPTKYPGDFTLVLSDDEKDTFIRYLRNLGCVSLATDIIPTTDGLNHYNIYSQAKTLLGQMASNFYADSLGNYFTTPHGDFKTLEGYYHFLRVVDYLEMVHGERWDECGTVLYIAKMHPELNKLASLDGATAIRYGREVKKAIYGGTSYRPGAFSDYAETCFMIAVVLKLHQLKLNGICLGNVIANLCYHNVPLEHYYVMNGQIKKPGFSEWLPNVYKKIVEFIDPNSTSFNPQDVIAALRGE